MAAQSRNVRGSSERRAAGPCWDPQLRPERCSLNGQFRGFGREPVRPAAPDCGDRCAALACPVAGQPRRLPQGRPAPAERLAQRHPRLRPRRPAPGHEYAVVVRWPATRGTRAEVPRQPPRCAQRRRDGSRGGSASSARSAVFGTAQTYRWRSQRPTSATVGWAKSGGRRCPAGRSLGSRVIPLEPPGRSGSRSPCGAIPQRLVRSGTRSY